MAINQSTVAILCLNRRPRAEVFCAEVMAPAWIVCSYPKVKSSLPIRSASSRQLMSWREISGLPEGYCLVLALPLAVRMSSALSATFVGMLLFVTGQKALFLEQLREVTLSSAKKKKA